MDRKGSAPKTIFLVLLAMVVLMYGALLCVALYSGLQEDMWGSQVSPDTLRVSDLYELQNGLALYYSAHGQYPTQLNDLITPGIVQVLPHDPTTGAPYDYAPSSDGQFYVLRAMLQNASNSLLQYNTLHGMVNGLDCDIPAWCIESPSGTSTVLADYQSGHIENIYQLGDDYFIKIEAVQISTSTEGPGGYGVAELDMERDFQVASNTQIAFIPLSDAASELVIEGVIPDNNGARRTMLFSNLVDLFDAKNASWDNILSNEVFGFTFASSTVTNISDSFSP